MREAERSAAMALGTAPSIDLVFDLLADRRRRYALYVLSETDDGVATVEKVVEGVLRLERRSEATGPTGPPEVHTALEHVHLPKLADAGVIEHDARSGTIRYRHQPSVEEWLEHARYKERL